MKKLLLSIVFAVVSIMSVSAAGFDVEKCKELLAVSDSVALNERQCAEAFAQIECVLGMYERSVEEISKMTTLDARKEAADRFNHSHKDEYNAYRSLLRRLIYQDKDGRLPERYAGQLQKIRERNGYVNSMYTKFRSRREL